MRIWMRSRKTGGAIGWGSGWPRGGRRSRSKNNGAANIADDQTATQASNGEAQERSPPSRKIQKQAQWDESS